MANGLLVAALAYLGIRYGVVPYIIRWAFRPPRTHEQISPAHYHLPYRTECIPTANGRRLFAWFLPASEGVPAPGVVLLHGWGGNAQAMLPFAPHLHRNGYAVLLIDSRNHGRSDSDDFSSLVKFAEDLQHALAWLRREPSVAPDSLSVLGHSVGAAAALLVASQDKRIRALVSIAAFAHPVPLMRRLLQAHHVPYRPVGWWVLRYIERQIGARYDAIAPLYTVRHVTCPVLLVHGDLDADVPVSDAHAVYAQRASEAVTLRILPDVSHSSVDKIECYAPELVRFLNVARRIDQRRRREPVFGPDP